MTTVSAYDQTRSMTTLDHPLALEVVLLKRTYVLPWSQFLYAEGDNDESASPSQPTMCWCKAAILTRLLLFLPQME